MGQIALPNRKGVFNKKGMTLIEIMFALVILLIASLALMKTAMLGISMNVQNVLRDEAVNVAEAEMNYLRGQTFTDTIDNITSAATYTVVSRNFRGFTENYAVTPSVAGITTDSKQINISVSWNYRGQTYTHGITSIVRKQ